MRKKDFRTGLTIFTLLIILVISILAYQTYEIYIIQGQLSELSIKQSVQGANIRGLQQEIKEAENKNQEDFEFIISQIQESSSQISELQQDISNIQVKSQDFTGIVDDVVKSVVSVITDVSQGSGVIIRSDGYIATNLHVIEGAKRIVVLTSDRNVYEAEFVDYSTSTDIALLKIEVDGLDYLEFGDSDDVEVGQRVIAVGNPAGLDFSVTEGIVSAVNRKANGNEYIQTDVPINPGNSGGPLVNINKEVIGINNFKIGGFESLGFALESNIVKEVVEGFFQS